MLVFMNSSWDNELPTDKVIDTLLINQHAPKANLHAPKFPNKCWKLQSTNWHLSDLLRSAKTRGGGTHDDLGGPFMEELNVADLNTNLPTPSKKCTVEKLQLLHQFLCCKL